jgi:predicted membrane-bound mannosyltransferase
MIGARPETRRPGKEAHRDTLSAARVIMKNFVRLVKKSWPHRYRFGLSIACAAMVALFFFTELFALLPLLKIIFNNENPQSWV